MSCNGVSPEVTSLSEFVESFDISLQAWLESTGIPEGEMLNAVLYSCLGGGKRIRPLFMEAIASIVKKEWRHANESKGLRLLQCCCEVIHCSTLVHDDLPALDNDLERRGQPTVHVKFGEAVAVLAGDALLALPTIWVSSYCDSPEVDSELSRRMIKALGSLARGTVEVCFGQTLDIGGSSPTALVSEFKTGKLFRAAAQAVLDLLVPQPDVIAEVTLLAEKFGKFFQMRDDYIEAAGNTKQKQRAGNSDVRNHKQNSIAVGGLSGGEKQLRQLVTSLLEDSKRLAQKGRGETEPFETILKSLVF